MCRRLYCTVLYCTGAEVAHNAAQEAGACQDAKQSSYLPPNTGTSSLGLGRTKDGSLLYNFLAGPSAAPAPAPTLGPILSVASSSSTRRPVRSS